MSPIPHDFDRSLFSPSTIELLRRVRDDAWRELRLRQSPAATHEKEVGTHEALAQAIVVLAAAGERDPQTLKRGAIAVIDAGQDAIASVADRTEAQGLVDLVALLRSKI